MPLSLGRCWASAAAGVSSQRVLPRGSSPGLGARTSSWGILHLGVHLTWGLWLRAMVYPAGSARGPRHAALASHSPLRLGSPWLNDPGQALTPPGLRALIREMETVVACPSEDTVGLKGDPHPVGLPPRTPSAPLTACAVYRGPGSTPCPTPGRVHALPVPEASCPA